MTIRKKMGYLLLTELAILIPKIFIVFQAIPVTDIRDEVAMLKVPAYIAGFDWSTSTSTASYYGFGFFAIFFPLFKLKVDILVIYRVILLSLSLLECIIPIVCFYMLEKFYNIEKNEVKSVISIIVSFVTVNPPYNLINEHVLIILVWLNVLLLCKLCCKQNKKERNWLSVLLAIDLLYALTIHTRALIMFIAVIVVILGYYFLFKEWIVTKWFTVISILGYVVVDHFITVVQAKVWGNNELVNASLGIPNRIEHVKDLSSFFDLVIGNIATSFIFSKSSLGFMVVAIVYFLFRRIAAGVKAEKEITIFDKTIFVTFVVCIICTVGTICGIGLQHMAGLKNAIEMGDNGSYHYKYFTYLRYYVSYLAPLFMGGLVLYIKKIDYYKKTIIIGSLFSAFTYLYYNYYVIPYISNNYFGINNFYTFSWLLSKNALDRIDSNEYRIVLLVSFTLIFIWIFCIKMEKYKYIPVFLLMGLLIYQFIYFPANYSKIVAQAQYSEIDASQDYIERAKEDKINFTIYVYDQTDRIPYLIQLYNYELNVISGLPQEDSEEFIVISNCQLSELLAENYIENKLDNNEWLYTKKDH